MDNCGFHHGHHIVRVLQNMLGLNGVDLVFQPPYIQSRIHVSTALGF